MSIGTESRGEQLAERLGLTIIGPEGHDLKCACISCSSSDGMRVHRETGIAFCHVCQSSWSRLKLAIAIAAEFPAKAVQDCHLFIQIAAKPSKFQ